MPLALKRIASTPVRAAVLFAIGFTLSCGTAGRKTSTDDRLEEFLSAAAARPLLTDDRGELLAYLRDFPRERYDLRPTKNGLSFFIEKEGPLDGIKQVLSKGEVWEADFTELMSLYIKPGSSVVDAGAYIGTHAMALARLTGREGRVLAFEPQKKVFRELVFNLIENRVLNVVPLRFALGSDVGMIEMENPVDGAEAAVGIGRGGDRVELRTLDSFRLRNVSFVKIDVEGFEGPVLDGARRTLADCGRPPILVEIQRAADYLKSPPDARARIEETLDKIEDYGYAVTPLAHRDYLALAAPDYAPGSVLSFTDKGGAGRFRSRWWSEPEPWGAWALGYGAGVVFVLDAPPKRALVLSAVAKALVGGNRPRREVEVVAGGRRVGRWSFTNRDFQRREAVIPASLAGTFAGKAVLRIAFRAADPASPSALGLSGDRRLLALGVRELTLRER
jgi:FkbM family methyltransferase